MIHFNKPYLSGNETRYIEDAVKTGKISGNGIFTARCQQFFEQKYGFRKCLLTTSCTDALEMIAILCDVGVGDEVIVPSYTFVSSALAFVRQGAKIVFADSYSNNPNIDPVQIESLITAKTKVIVVVHYAGVACDMDKVMSIANKYGLLVVEDAAQAVDSYYTSSSGEKVPLGGIGHFGAFSFHETKNIIAGEGGMLVINDSEYIKRAEIIWEKGTNRAEFFRGEVNKYGWVDIGSSFLPSEITSAFLLAQIESLNRIQQKRIEIWERYFDAFISLADRGQIILPTIPDCATNNAHMFYLIFTSLDHRSDFIKYMKDNGILTVFHYLSLHRSEFYLPKHDGRKLPNCDRFADCLVRLPLYFELTENEQNYIINKVVSFFTSHSVNRI
jgi:dTDP-4-amino-4,6-dideoxygalactose transaminase